MLSAQFFIDSLAAHGVDFFTGVPDSLLKNVCAYITDHFDAHHNIIAANEGAAVSLAAGYYLATRRIACVYMQNSGEGNAVNPLASLTDPEVYNIPLLLLIGWRGRPGVHDEPQHVKQGKVTTGLLNVMGINYEVLSKEAEVASKQIEKAFASMTVSNAPFALVVEKDTFENYMLQNKPENDYPMSREQAIQMVTSMLDPRAAIVSTTGMISRELFEYRAAQGQDHRRDFLTVGSMGHASQIALGIALQQPDRQVCCFDGDGAVIMHMGSLAVLAALQPHNLIHVVFNNGAHDSVGGQPTVGYKIDLPAVALGLGYSQAVSVSTAEELQEFLPQILLAQGPVLIEIRVHRGNRPDLGRPTTTPQQNKEAFMNFLISE